MRNMIWFNPTYNRSVKINVDEYFRGLLLKPLPLNHKCKKYVTKNKSTVKISYLWILDLKAKIIGATII